VLASNGNTSTNPQADASTADSVLNDDLMEQVLFLCSAMNCLLKHKAIVIAVSIAVIYANVRKYVHC